MLLFSSTTLPLFGNLLLLSEKGEGTKLHLQKGLELGAETLNDLLTIKGAKIEGLEDRASGGHNFPSRSEFIFTWEDNWRDALFCVELTLHCPTFREGGVRRQYPPYFHQRVTWSKRIFFSRPNLHLCLINDLKLFREMGKQESALMINRYVYMTCNTLSSKSCSLLAEFEATLGCQCESPFETFVW